MKVNLNRRTVNLVLNEVCISVLFMLVLFSVGYYETFTSIFTTTTVEDIDAN